MSKALLLLVAIANLLWGVGWGFWPLIPLYASRIGLSPFVYGLVYGVGLGIAAGSGILGGLLASQGPRVAWGLVVASYAVSGLGVLVMILMPSPLGFVIGYALYAFNSVGWAPLAALLSAYRSGPRVIVAILSSSVRLGALIGSFLAYTASTLRGALVLSSVIFLASAVPAAAIDPGHYGGLKRLRFSLRFRLDRLALLFGLLSAAPLLFQPYVPLYLKAAGLRFNEVPLVYVANHVAAIVLPLVLAPYPGAALMFLSLAPLLVYVGTVYSNIAVMTLGVLLMSLAGTLDEIMYSALSRLRPGDPLAAGLLQTARNVARVPLAWTGGALMEFSRPIHVAVAVGILLSALVVYRVLSRKL